MKTLAQFVLFLVLFTPVSLAQDSELTDDAAEPTPADIAFEPLQKKFDTLSKSLQMKGGIEESDEWVLDRILDEAKEFTNQFPNDERGLAIELQLNIWLKNEERTIELYDHFVESMPDDPRILTSWATLMKERNKYRNAIAMLESKELNPETQAQAIIILAECLFAEERFKDAIETFRSIPQEVIDTDFRVRSDVDRVKPFLEEYVDLWNVEKEIREEERISDDLPRATIVTSRGEIKVELFENQAPNTVANFIKLAESGFYDGTKFHRVISDFMAQGGDQNSKDDVAGVPGQGNPGHLIKDEHDREDHRKHFTGSLAMAKQNDPHTAGSQFYLTHKPVYWLNGKHTVFGRTLEGLDIIRSIKLNDVVETVTITRKRDHEYEPEIIPVDAPPPTTQPVIEEITSPE